MKSIVAPFLKASLEHVGGTAIIAALRHDLVERGSYPADDFDSAYAVSRLTPGTNLLAFYTLLGHRLGGWRISLTALAIGLLIPAVITLAMAVAYESQQANPLLVKGMRGARAGALAVFIWAALRLARPQVAQHRRRGPLVAAASLAFAVLYPGHPTALLVTAAVVGAVALKTRP